MRYLGVTETCDLGAMYLSLAAEGHEVRISISEPKAQGTLRNLVQRTDDWKAELDWIREAGSDGIVLFEAVSEGFGAVQDGLRQDGYCVVGGSAFGDRLENDRAFAQRTLSQLGLPIAATHEFSDAARADRFVAEHPGRYVLKFSGPDYASSDNYVGRLADGSDVCAMMAARVKMRAGEPCTFILMDYLEGVEMGVGAYFDGEHFLRPACLDWEHKRFFAGDQGELTGEMGTVATFDRSERFFARTLRPMEPLLRDAGHVGYVNLNTIVNDRGIWPLEFTCRFGYPGFAVLAPLQESGWADILDAMANRSSPSFQARSGFSVGIVLTTPPFPYSRHDIEEPVGLPVLLPDSFDEADRSHVHFGEMGLADGRLVTSGVYGWTMVVTGTGTSIGDAQRDAYRRIERVIVPNARYRLDIGDRLAARDYATVEALELLSAT